MRIDIITIFPEIFTPLEKSIVKRAREAGHVEIVIHNLRDYTSDFHRTVDDAPYGGGAGMVMKIEPLFKALSRIRGENPEEAHVLLTSPQGKTFSQSMAVLLSEKKWIIMICGHYEGIDERVAQHLCDDEVSIGDYVLTGGELPAMVIIDAVVRLLPGVIDGESLKSESFSENMLDFPQYTRPREFQGWAVPDVLLSGNHKEIERWRREKRLEKTRARRPDLLSNEQSAGEVNAGSEKELYHS
ncbi:MAG: tRNA (guanosine(37)-N1)-methyltransferase TrmD [Candidatus Xenobiia bacterium LiM19]